jgi:hypothetical protein
MHQRTMASRAMAVFILYSALANTKTNGTNESLKVCALLSKTLKPKEIGGDAPILTLVSA